MFRTKIIISLLIIYQKILKYSIKNKELESKGVFSLFYGALIEADTQATSNK